MQTDGRRSKAAHLLISFTFRGEKAVLSRLGITVTKKIDKRAVRLNYIKRAVREWFRRTKNYLSEPLDVVVVALSGSAELSAPQLWSELDEAFKRARLIPRNFNFSPTPKKAAKSSSEKANESD